MTGFTVVVFSIFCVGTHLDIKKYFWLKIEKQQFNLDSQLPKILTDLRLLEKSPFFPKNTYQNNAEPFLSEHVSWTGIGFKPLETPSHLKLRDFFKSKVKLDDPEQINLRSQDSLLDQIDTKNLKTNGLRLHK